MKSLVEKYKPSKIDGFAGLAKPRAILKAIAANPYDSAWLFLGPSGIGKTTMTLAFADEVGAELHHIPAKQCDLATVQDVVQACHYVPFFGKWHLVLVDEADQMTKPAQLAFLSKLDTTAAPLDEFSGLKLRNEDRIDEPEACNKVAIADAKACAKRNGVPYLGVVR